MCLSTLAYHLLLAVSKKNMMLAGCLIILILAQFIAVIVYYAKLKSVQSFAQSDYATLTSHTLAPCSALLACVDTAIALSIVVLLRRHSSEVFSKRTSSMVNRIMIYTVGSGLLTAGFAVAGLVTIFTMKTNSVVSSAILELVPKREPSLENSVYMSTDHNYL